MKKRTYRSLNVNQINWTKVSEAVASQAQVLAIDIAKVEQYGVLMNASREVSVQVNWRHPEQTPELLLGLSRLRGCVQAVALESTGVYGDTLRHQLMELGYRVFQVSAKRVHDACAVYDGVSSLHDAKSAHLIARLYWEGASREWVESSVQQRQMDALWRTYELHQGTYQRHRNRLEAQLQRHWPEVTKWLELDSVTLETLLIEFGTPEAVAKETERARGVMQQASHAHLSGVKIEAILESAPQSQGLACIDAERAHLQALGRELRHHRQQRAQAQRQLEASVEADQQLQAMSQTIGKLSTALLLAERLDPRTYSNSQSYQKALGLNLKEKSSGQHHGALRISKCGSARARKYLYLASLRLIYRDTVVAAWYQRKVQRDGGHKSKAVTAVMRKLAQALWYVARGSAFDARQLFNLKATSA